MNLGFIKNRSFARITLLNTYYLIVTTNVIIFLYGPDTFRSRQKLNQIKEKFIREVDKTGLNIQILNGQTLEPSEFEIAVHTQPFFFFIRLVIVEDLLSKNRGQKVQKEILEIINQNKLADTILVFWESEIGDTKAKKSKLAKQRSHNLLNLLKQEKYAQPFELLNETGVKHFAQNEIKRRGQTIQPEALQLLTDLVGNDLWQLNTELEKLSAFANQRPITVADIETLVKTKLDDDIFKLTDALGQKNKSLALKLIADQLDLGTNPGELLARITWQFKNLLLVKDFLEQNGAGYTPTRLSYQLGLHPFVIQKTIAACRYHELTNLKKTYHQLIKIDYQLKTSQTNPELLFDLLVIRS